MTDTQVTWLTEEAYDRLKAELDQLITNRPQTVKEISDRALQAAIMAESDIQCDEKHIARSARRPEWMPFMPKWIWATACLKAHSSDWAGFWESRQSTALKDRERIASLLAKSGAPKAIHDSDATALLAAMVGSIVLARSTRSNRTLSARILAESRSAIASRFGV